MASKSVREKLWIYFVLRGYDDILCDCDVGATVQRREVARMNTLMLDVAVPRCADSAGGVCDDREKIGK